MNQKTNPFKDKPCNYKSYGDFCDPTTCWCSMASKWDLDNPQPLPTETIEVTGCGDCPFHAFRGESERNYCSIEQKYETDKPLFTTCPLKKSSLTIKLKNNDTERN